MNTQESIEAAAKDVTIFLPLIERMLRLFGLVLHHVQAPPEADQLLAEAHSARTVIEQTIAPRPAASTTDDPPKTSTT